MKIYISGAITNDPDYQTKFDACEQFLTALGYQVINPAKNKLPKKKDSWDDYMKLSLDQLKECEIIFLLPRWQNSRGAKIEYRAAVDAEMAFMKLTTTRGEPKNFSVDQHEKHHG